MHEPDQIAYARRVVGQDPMATLLGLQVEEVAPGRAVLSLVPGPRHQNSLGRVHGTALYALADQAAAVAANTLPGGVLLCECKINFLAGASPGVKLVATAQALDVKRKLSLWEVRVSAPDGTLVALAQALAYHAASAPARPE